MRKKKIEIVIHTSKSPLGLKMIRKYFNKILEIFPELKCLYWSISIISDQQMKKLNFQFTGRNNSTDVLSFLYQDNSFPLAEVIISASQAYKNSTIFKTTPSEELILYLIHGILHIMGYNDSGSKEKNKMSREQGRLFKEILK